MGKHKLICAAAALSVVMAGAACSSAKGDERAMPEGKSSSGDSVTVAGCLSSSSDGRFALTAAPDATGAIGARAVTDDRDTNSYVLIGGDNLQAHIGKRVEVVGTLAGKTQDMEHKDTKETTATDATGGKETPTVKTKEEIDLEVRQLNVLEVRDLAPTCVVNP